MDAEKKRLRDEVAELAEAVRALRDELAQERLARMGRHCCHYYTPVPYYYPMPTIYQPYTVTCGTSTSTIPGTVTTNAYALT